MININITGIDGEMRGVGRLPDGRAVFVPRALPGEEVEIEVEREAERFATARLARVARADAERIEPDCPYYAQCGGCQLRHVKYETGLALKVRAAREAIERIGKITDARILPAIPNPQRLRNRNKAEFSVTAEGELALTAQRSSALIPIDDCLIQTQAAVARAKSVAAAGQRYIVVRSNMAGETQLTVSAFSKAFWPGADYACHLRPRPAHALDGKIARLSGPEKLTETLFGLKFALSPNSFFQTDAAQAEKLYAAALEIANIDSQDNVLDAYSGAGTISLAAAMRAKLVTGVEIVPEAVRDAIENARQNNMENKARFILGDAANALSQNSKFDVMIVDPPRRGLDEKLVQAAITAGPGRIAYVSCNPATFARDAGRLSPAYRLKSVRLVDMFPNTANSELAAALERK